MGLSVPFATATTKATLEMVSPALMSRFHRQVKEVISPGCFGSNLNIVPPSAKEDVMDLPIDRCAARSDGME
jgi:hypothetical protein